jgi:hypothetical protein
VNSSFNQYQTVDRLLDQLLYTVNHIYTEIHLITSSHTFVQRKHKRVFRVANVGGGTLLIYNC